MTTGYANQGQRAIIYLRESDSRMTKSLPSQREACRDYCAERGYLVVAVLQDILTGDALWERTGLSQARALIREGSADVLVLNDSFRLSRNMNHRIYLREELLHYGCRVEYVTAAEDDSKEGALLEIIKDYAGDVEREKIIERSTRGRFHRASQRKVLPGGTLLYGYMWGEPVPVTGEDGLPIFKEGMPLMDRHARYVLNPDTHWVVERIYKEVAAGRSLRQIAIGLDADNIPTPSARSRYG